MSTINFTNTTNNANQTEWSYSTKLVFNTDRATSAHARHAELTAKENLGIGVKDTNPFTILA